MANPRLVPQLEVTRLAGSLGAEIHGIQLAKAGPADADAIRSLLMEHQVLFFPDQHLTPDQHIAFGRLFGQARVPSEPLARERAARVLRAARQLGRRRDRRRVAQRPHLPGRALAARDPAHGEVPGGRRRHAVGERVQGLRRALAGDEGLLRGALGAARRAPARQPGADGGAPGGARAPGDEAEVAVRERALHAPDRRALPSGERGGARASWCAGSRARASRSATTGPRARSRCGTTAARSTTC